MLRAMARVRGVHDVVRGHVPWCGDRGAGSDVMNAVAQSFALIAALIHVTVWVFESFLMNRPAIHRGVFRIATADLPAIRLWSFNVGFYNLFLAAAPIAGVIALHTGDEAVGRALVIYGCSFMFLAGIVLGVSDRMGLGRAKGAGLSGALGQSVPPLIALVAAAF